MYGGLNVKIVRMSIKMKFFGGFGLFVVVVVIVLGMVFKVLFDMNVEFLCYMNGINVWVNLFVYICIVVDWCVIVVCNFVFVIWLVDVEVELVEVNCVYKDV